MDWKFEKENKTVGLFRTQLDESENFGRQTRILFSTFLIRFIGVKLGDKD